MTIGPSGERDAAQAFLRKLARDRTRARAVLAFERVWPAAWPTLGVAGLFLCAALLDLLPTLPAWAHIAVLALFAAALAATVARAARRWRMPDAAEADRRLERASGLRHRPLAAIADRPAQPGGEALWRAHVARATAQLARLRVGTPRPGLAARDPRALRAGLVVALVACAAVAGLEAPARLARALAPGFVPPAAAPASQLQAWITPPGYTGLAPVFLKPETPAVSVPAGSHLTVSLTGGGGGEPALTLAGRAASFTALDAASFQADAELATGGRMEVRRHGATLGAWELTVVADVPPVASFPEPPGRLRGARGAQTRLPWQVSHGYGVVSLQAELRLRDRPDAQPLVVAIPLPGGAPKEAHGMRVQDLSAHPWAGLPVVGRLVAKDAPGLAGASADATFELPERRFENPVARALVAVRKELSRHPDARGVALMDLDGISRVPEAWGKDWGAFLNLRGLMAQLRYDQGPRAVESVQARLWLLALHLEEAAPERTSRELEQARQAVREMMDQEKRGDPVDRAELDRRMKAVEEALQKHLQALAEQARRDPGSQQFDPDAHPMDARDMQRLADEARKLAQEGKMDAARDKLAELDQLLQELQMGRPEHGRMTERERQRAEKRQRGEQQMNALQDMVQREGALMDTAQQRDSGGPRDARRPPRPGELGSALNQRPPGAQARPPSGGRPPGERADRAPADPQAPGPAQSDQQRQEARVQQALRRALGELMQQYGDLTGQVPPNLGDADSAMRDAAQALAQGQDGPAAGAQLKAIEALQKGGRSMSMQLAQQFGRGGEGDDDGDGDGQGEQAGSPGEGGQPGGQYGGQYGGQQYGRDDGRGGRPWDPRGRADRRADDRRDPLGRPLREGTAGADESGDVRVPEKMEEARTRAIQDELRRRDADRSRPQPELDYIERLLKQF